eukprot:3704238-Karenia_brevis.AAC.1
MPPAPPKDPLHEALQQLQTLEATVKAAVTNPDAKRRKTAAKEDAESEVVASPDEAHMSPMSEIAATLGN